MLIPLSDSTQKSLMRVKFNSCSETNDFVWKSGLTDYVYLIYRRYIVRKFFLPLALLAILAMGLVPAFAQDEGPASIAELVISLTEAEEPEFTTLLTAVTLADPSVLEALSDPEAELTVFAPTDAAFEALAEALGEEAFGAILEDQEALTNILLYHVVGAAVMSETVVTLDGEEVETLLEGATLTVGVGEAMDDTTGVTLNETVNVIAVDVTVGNSVVHVIDAVLVPAADDEMMEEDMDGDMDDMDDDMVDTTEFTIAELVIDAASLEEGAEFTFLLAAVSAADPAVLELLSDEEAEVTVFAPLDSAFEALAEALGEEAFNGILEDQELLTNILLYHVVDGAVMSDVVVTLDGEEVPTLLEGASYVVGVGEPSDENPTGVTLNETINVVIVDVPTKNGVIHIIDAVLVPAAE